MGQKSDSVLIPCISLISGNIVDFIAVSNLPPFWNGLLLEGEGKGFGLILPLHNARSFMRVGVFFNLGNLPVAAVVDPAILIIVLLAFAGLG